MEDNPIVAFTEQKKGPTSRFQFSISFFEWSSKDIQFIKAFEIANLAIVQFHVLRDSLKFYIFLRYMKHALTENSFIKIHITCEALNYSAKFSCSENWSEVSLGEMKAIVMKRKMPHSFVGTTMVDVYTATMDLFIKVYREKNISNPLLYENQEFTDFALLGADGSVAVHKACLAGRSDVFRRMFAGKWKETVEGGVDVKHVPKQTLQRIKDFIYLGKLPDDRLRPLIVVAKKYLITDLVEACAKKLAETVLPEDLYSLHELACLNNLPELSCAIAELTPDRVVHEAYLIKMAKRNTALTTDKK